MRMLFPVFGMLILFCGNTLQAQNFHQAVDEVLIHDKVIIAFHEEVTEADKQAFFQTHDAFQHYDRHINLPSPDITLARLAQPLHSYQQFTEWQATWQQDNRIRYAGILLKTSHNSFAGVLDKVFVKANKAELLQLLPQLAGDIEYTFEGERQYQQGVYTISAPVRALELAVALHKSGVAEWAEPNYLLSPLVCSTNDTYYDRQWNIENTGSSQQHNGTPGADMDVVNAWTITTGDPNVKLSVIDSGVDTLHEDLQGVLLPGFDALGDGTNGYPTPNYDSDGHGTACTGIIAANADNNMGIAGVAYGVKVAPVRTFYYIDTTVGTIDLGVIPFSTSQAMSDAIGWSWQTADVDIMSNSWGLPAFLFSLLPGDPATVEQAIDDAVANGRNGKGCVLVFSSGNEGGNAIWPSKLGNTVAVNSTSMCDEAKTSSSCDGESWWTGSHGHDLTFSAPGVKIFTTDMTGANGYHGSAYYNSFNGTSSACPNAAGVFALLFSLRPDLTADDAIYILSATADTVGGYDYSDVKRNLPWSFQLGHGRLNAYKALTMAQNYSVGINELNHDGISLYPNPFSQQLQLRMPATTKAATLQLFDASGRQLLQQPLQGGAQTIDTGALPKGLYLFRITSGNSHWNGKIVAH